MRLFIACDADEIHTYLETIQKELTDVSLTHKFHITLKFLGEISLEKTEILKNRIQSLSFKKFTAQLTTTGVFPDEEHARVLWIGVKPTKTWIKLQKEIEYSIAGLFSTE